MRFQQKFPRLTFHGGAHPQIGYASVFLPATRARTA